MHVGVSNLSRGAIIDAALALVDAEGLAALNMRRLAERLGSKPMSLYRHIPSKAALLDELAQAVLANVVIASDTDTEPIEAAFSALRSFRSVLLKHPNTLPLFAGPGVSAGAAEQFELMEAALAAGEAAGLGVQQSLRAYAVALAYVVGFVMRETASPTTLAVDETSDAAWLATLRALPEADYPRVRNAATRIRGREDPDELFEYGLQALVSGFIQQQAER
jgi:AcrR family transcriptional regulator